MKKVKLLLACFGLALFVSSCSLTEDGIVPKNGFKDYDGTISDEPILLPPPPPPGQN